MERRHTIQKDIVLDAVRMLATHATADDVYEYIHDKHPNIGKGTVYRNLNILAQEGEIRKIGIPEGPDRFDHTCTDHYHVRCIKCGDVTDVDMDVIPNMIDNIHNTHGMKFLDFDIIFSGICSNCQNR